MRLLIAMPLLLVVGLLSGCGSSDRVSDQGSETSGTAGSLAQNQYPEDLVGRYSDRSCDESKMIEETVDMWPGFEIALTRKTEQALSCAPMEVSAVEGGYGITEQCTVMGSPDVVVRRPVYQTTSTGLDVTIDSKKKSYGRC
jgi:hypothetical protein